MVKNAEFERCMDFLARMIEKYGNDVVLPETANDLQADRIAPAAEAGAISLYFERKLYHGLISKHCALDVLSVA